jgi:hypothetical protein
VQADFLCGPRRPALLREWTLPFFARHWLNEQYRAMSQQFEVSDHDLLARAVRGALDSRKNKGVEHPRWVAVMDLFVLGSNHAHWLCQRFNIDPDEMVKR